MQKKSAIFMLAGNNVNGMLTRTGQQSSRMKNKLLKEATQQLTGKIAVAYNSLQLYSEETARLAFQDIPGISFLKTPNSDLSTQTPYDYQKSMALIEKLFADNPRVDTLVIVSTAPLCEHMPNMLAEKYLGGTFEYDPINENQILLMYFDVAEENPIRIFAPDPAAIEA